MWVCLVMNKRTPQRSHSIANSLRVTHIKNLQTLFPVLRSSSLKKWQQLWNSCAENKLLAIGQTVGGHQQESSLSHRDDLIINRLVIGGGEGVIRCQQYSIWLFVDNMWSSPGLNSGSPALPTIYINDFIIIIIISIIMLQCCHEHRCITLSTRICAAEMAVRYAALSACRKVHP